MSAEGDNASVSPSAAPVGVASDTPGTQPRTSLPRASTSVPADAAAAAADKVSAVAEKDAAGDIKLEQGSPFGGAGGARSGMSGPNAAGVAGVAGAAGAVGTAAGAAAAAAVVAAAACASGRTHGGQPGQHAPPAGLQGRYVDFAIAQMMRGPSPNMLPLAGMFPFAAGAMASHSLLPRQQTLVPPFPPRPPSSSNPTQTKTPATADGQDDTGKGPGRPQDPKHPGVAVAGSGTGSIVGGGGKAAEARDGTTNPPPSMPLGGMAYGTGRVGMGTAGQGGDAWRGLGGGGGGSAASAAAGGLPTATTGGGGDMGAAYKRRVYQMLQMQRMQQLQLMQQHMQQQAMLRGMQVQAGGGMQQPGQHGGQGPTKTQTGQKGGVYTGHGAGGMGGSSGSSSQQTAGQSDIVAATHMAAALQAMHGGSLRYATVVSNVVYIGMPTQGAVCGCGVVGVHGLWWGVLPPR